MNRKRLGILAAAAALGAAVTGCANDDGNPPQLSGFQMDRLHGNQTVGGVTVGAAPTPEAQRAAADDVDDERAVRASGSVAPQPQPQGPFYSNSGLDRARAANRDQNAAAADSNNAQPQNVSGPGAVFVDGDNDGFDDNTGAARERNTNTTSAQQAASSSTANPNRATGRGGATGNPDGATGANSGVSSGGPRDGNSAGSNNNPGSSNSPGSTGGNSNSAGSSGGNSNSAGSRGSSGGGSSGSSGRGPG
jgi:hypothetical protein